MTEKQEKILGAALELFAEQGYAGTSTSKVAKAAGVSEGLIFRHFENKEGLLNAIMQQGQRKVGEMFERLQHLEDPKEIIRQVIDLPFQIGEEERPFWKLLYALKWQKEVYDDTMSAPIKSVLVPAFLALNYKNPEAEAEVVMVLIDGLAVAILLRKPDHLQHIRQSIFEKYQL